MNERTPKGWCPTTRKPMPSGDGLLMRLKPQRHTISVQELEVICDAATAFGSSMIALTNRANLQIRGLDEASYAQLIQRCIQADIIPQDTPIYEDLNLLVSPFGKLAIVTALLQMSLPGVVPNYRHFLQSLAFALI